MSAQRSCAHIHFNQPIRIYEQHLLQRGCSDPDGFSPTISWAFFGFDDHTLMTSWEFLGYGLLSVVLAALIAYPFSMNYAHRGGFVCSTAARP